MRSPMGVSSTDHEVPSTMRAYFQMLRSCGSVRRGTTEGLVVSPQTLSEADRRLVAGWAADCAERVLGLYEGEAPDDDRPRALIARTRAFASGDLKAAEEIRRRFAGGVGAGDVRSPAAMAAAR